jgi:hypothetical protein
MVFFNYNKYSASEGKGKAGIPAFLGGYPPSLTLVNCDILPKGLWKAIFRGFAALPKRKLLSE